MGVGSRLGLGLTFAVMGLGSDDGCGFKIGFGFDVCCDGFGIG
jgi:hypothetical protein